MPGSSRSVAAGQWLVVALLGAIAACLVVEVGWGVSSATAAAMRTSGPGAADVVVVAGQVTADTYGLYLVDLKNGTIGVYQYLTGGRKLRLMAVRNFTFDVQLDEYNTEPAPREIKKLVEQHKRLGDEG